MALAAMMFGGCTGGENSETVEVPTAEPKDVGQGEDDACASESAEKLLEMDWDGDGELDVFDEDWDNDGVPNGEDNCAWFANADQADANADGRGDACEDLEDPIDELIYPASISPAFVFGILVAFGFRARTRRGSVRVEGLGDV
ncbi:MAG: thrombospondin type 3 repeat-containing protein [Deltaproteobacteria bacterium]|nr:thrombospondin type 3 repeat-containing protein [Deltaproteobacteria bacterium]